MLVSMTKEKVCFTLGNVHTVDLIYTCMSTVHNHELYNGEKHTLRCVNLGSIQNHPVCLCISIHTYNRFNTIKHYNKR